MTKYYEEYANGWDEKEIEKGNSKKLKMFEINNVERPQSSVIFCNRPVSRTFV